MWEFIKRNKYTILVGIIALIAGYFLNVYANNQSERKIIEALTAEIESIKAKQQSGTRLSATEQTRIIELQAQKNIIAARYGYCSSCKTEWQQKNCPYCNS